MTVDNDVFGHQHVTVIEAPSGWRRFQLRELWSYREVLRVFTRRDIKVRYRQTYLGFAWAILQPLLLMVIFTIVFGRIANVSSDDVPYPIFVYSGLVAWTFFSNALSSATNSVIGAVPLVEKIYFPRLLIPIASVGAWLLDFVVASVVLGGMMVYYDVGPDLGLLMVPLIIVGLVCTALAVGTALAGLAVSYRDFRFVVPFVLQGWLLATPVAYPASVVPDRFDWVLSLNPMAGMIESFRASVLGQPIPVGRFMISLAVVLVLLVVAVSFFERIEHSFADVI